MAGKRPTGMRGNGHRLVRGSGLREAAVSRGAEPAAAPSSEMEALMARYRALTHGLRAQEQAGVFADHLRLSAWAMQLPSTGLAMFRAGRIATSNVGFSRL